MHSRLLRQFCALPAVVVIAALPARADTVKLFNKPAFREVTITDFDGRRLVFRGVSGQFLRKPPSEIEWIAVKDQPDLVAAEQALQAGSLRRAADLYESVRKAVERESWPAVWVDLRRVSLYERQGAFDKAIRAWADLRSAGVGLDEDLAPRPLEHGTAANRQAAAWLDSQLSDRGPVPRRTLRRMRLELAIFENPQQLPDPFTYLDQPEENDQRDAPATQSTNALEALMAAKVRRQRRQRTRLSPDSYVFAAARAANDAREYARAARILRRALQCVPEDERTPAMVIEQQRAALELGAPAEAAGTLLTLVEAEKTPPGQAARALYYAARAHERLRRPDVAAELYREAAAHPGAEPGLRTRALKRAEELG